MTLSSKKVEIPDEEGIWNGDLAYPEKDVKEFIRILEEGNLIDNLTRVCWEEFQMERYQTEEETLKKLKLKIAGQVEKTLKEEAGEDLI